MLVECEHCGKRIAERTVRCPFCGQRARSLPTAPSAAVETPTDGPQAPTKPVDLAKLARLAQDIESAQSRRRRKQDRRKVVGLVVGVLAVVAAAVAMMPWLRSMQALSGLGDVKGGGAAHMAAQRVASENAGSGGGETGSGESSDAGAGDAGKALAERAGSGLAAPTDPVGPAAAPATPPSSAETSTASGTATLARLDDLAQLERSGARPKSTAQASSQGEQAARRAKGEELDARTWAARLGGFVAGCALAGLLSWSSGLAAGRSRHSRLGRWARVLPSVVVAVAAAAYLGRDLGPELAKRLSNSLRSSPSSPAVGRQAASHAALSGSRPSAPVARPAPPSASAAESPAGAPEHPAMPSEPTSAAAPPAQPATPAGAPAADTAKPSDRPTTFVALMGELRQRASARPPAKGSFARLRGAVAARRTSRVVASTATPARGAPGAPAEARAGSAAPPAAPALPGAPPASAATPSASSAEAAQTPLQAALMGLGVGLVVGCSVGVARRLGGRGLATAATVLVVTGGAPATGHAEPSYGEALASKFVACYEAEGNPVGEEDRAALGSVAAELSELAPASAGGPLCPGATELASCATEVAGLSCEQVAEGLSSALAVSLTDPAPQAWSESYGKAVADKIASCAAAESGGTPAPLEDVAALNDYATGLASLLGSLVSAGGCTANPQAMSGCLTGIHAASCPSTLDAVGATLAPPVPANGASGAEQTPTMEDAEAAAEADAPALSDAELDQQIDAVAANTKSPVPFLADVCAQLLTCGTDAFDENAP